MARALYAKRMPGLDEEGGPFTDAGCSRLGAVAVFNVRLVSEIEYRFALYENPHALPAVAVPPDFAEGYQRVRGDNVDTSARPAGESPIAGLLRDESWTRDPVARAREEARRYFLELDGRKSAETEALAIASAEGPGCLWPRAQRGGADSERQRMPHQDRGDGVSPNG
jgi:hypothetical protein